MSDSERETRDLLIEIRTKLDVAITRQDDQEIRIRDINDRLARCVTHDDLKARFAQVIGVVTTIVVIVGGVVGLVAALV